MSTLFDVLFRQLFFGAAIYSEDLQKNVGGKTQISC